MNSRLLAITAYLGGRLVEKLAVSDPVRSVSRRLRGWPTIRGREDVTRLAAKLVDNVWASTCLAVAIETGLVDTLDKPRSLDDLAARSAMPAAMVEAVLDVLIGLGLLRRNGDVYVPAPGLADLIRCGGSHLLGAELNAGLRQAECLFREAREGTLSLGGWRHTDPQIIAAQGAASMRMTDDAAPMLSLLPGLEERLTGHGAMLLDVGAGAAGVSIALCRRYPGLRAVGLEPAAAPIAIGREKVADAGLERRIELRRQPIQDFAEIGVFDLAFLPQVFLADDVVEAAMDRVYVALKPGGWALVVTMDDVGNGLSSALGRMKGLLWGGCARSHEEVRKMVARMGFRPVITPRGDGTLRMICARRPQPAMGRAAPKASDADRPSRP